MTCLPVSIANKLAHWLNSTIVQDGVYEQCLYVWMALFYLLFRCNTTNKFKYKRYVHVEPPVDVCFIQYMFHDKCGDLMLFWCYDNITKSKSSWSFSSTMELNTGLWPPMFELGFSNRSTVKHLRYIVRLVVLVCSSCWESQVLNHSLDTYSSRDINSLCGKIKHPENWRDTVVLED